MTALTQKRTNHSFSPGNQGPVPQKFMRHGRLFLVLLLNVLLLTVNLGALDPNTPIDKYIHHTWTTRDGLPQNTIHSIVQDGYGYLWLGTDRGAVRFDGTNFRTFTNINVAEIKNNSITSLFIAGDGTVWIGTYGGGVTRYREKNFKNYSTKEGLPNHFINAIAEDSHQNIWFGTTGDGVIHFDPATSTFTTISDAMGLSYNIVTCLLTDSRGRIWAGTERGLNCLKFNGNAYTISTFTEEDGLLNNHVLDVYEDSKANLWIGTVNGVSKVRNRRADLQGGKFITIATGDGLPGKRVNSVQEDKNGNIWLGTNGGLARIRRETSMNLPESTGDKTYFDIYTTRDGLSDNAVTTVFQDKWGNLWAGTSGGGLNMFREGKFSFYTEKDGLSINQARAIYEDYRRDLWIGTDGGGLNRFRNGSFKTFTDKDGLSSNYVDSIYGDRAGNLWIGTDNGLNRFKDNRFHHYTTENGLSNNSIKTIFEDSAGTLWIGTNGGGLNRLVNNKFKIYNENNGLADDFVLSLEEDRFGNLWIGTNKGVSCFDHKNGLFRTFPAGDGVPTGRVPDIYCDLEGSLWIATDTEGLVHYKNGRFTSIKTAKGFGSQVIWRILEDDGGNLWLSTPRGIFSVSLRRLNAYVQRQETDLEEPENGWDRFFHWRHFQEADGLKTSVCSGGFQPAGWKTRNNAMWFPTIKGLAVMDLKKPVFIVQKDDNAVNGPGNIDSEEGFAYLTVVREQPVIIEKIVADGITLNPKSKISLPCDTERLEFFFTAINYGEPGNMMFKYQLDDYDDQWIVTTSRKSIVYLDLLPGEYTFNVAARPGGGDWSYGNDSCTFSIQYRFIQTFWFYFLITLSLALIFWGIPKIREKWLKPLKIQFSTIPPSTSPENFSSIADITPIPHTNLDDKKYKSSTLTPEKSKLYLEQLLEIMNEEKPFLDPALSLQKLAARIGITKEDLSQVINEQLDKNFKNFINEYRIEEAKKKLVDPRENQYVLLKIAFDVGFNSKSAFNASFKKITGISPSQYRKKHQQSIKNNQS